MDNKNINRKIDDIEVAERKYLKSGNIKFIKFNLIIYPVIIFIVLLLLSFHKSFLKFPLFSNFNSDEKDETVLGHFPYEETSDKNLIEIEPNIFVHKDMYKSLLRMKSDAERDGVFLVFLSGYRSIKLQKQIFYSLKSLRNQIAAERARVSAPPGYSEHSTGFAIDIGDAYARETDFEESFEKTTAFRWLKINAAKYHFKLSFDKKQTAVDYEPWHWRYEGSIEALKTFETSNRRFYNF